MSMNRRKNQENPIKKHALAYVGQWTHCRHSSIHAYRPPARLLEGKVLGME